MFLKKILSCNFISLLSDLIETSYVINTALNAVSPSGVVQE